MGVCVQPHGGSHTQQRPRHAPACLAAWGGPEARGLPHEPASPKSQPRAPEQAALAGAVGPCDQQVCASWDLQAEALHQQGVPRGHHHRLLKNDGIIPGQDLPPSLAHLACVGRAWGET